MNWLALAVMLAPIYVALFLVFWMAWKAGDKAEAVLQRIEAIDLVDDHAWDGRLDWPVDDAAFLEGLREEAGDEDDRKRQQLNAIIAMGGRRH